MRSIDNLREWWRDRFPVMDRQLGCDFREHIDAIEFEVEELRDRDYRNGMEDGEMAAERDGWVRLPVDADGEAIHVGDVMENIVCPPVHREVTGVGVECFYGWDEGNGRYSQFDVACYRHHHAPTVEDVLREFTDEVWNRCCEGATASDSGIDELVAEYAAKLRLAGEDA